MTIIKPADAAPESPVADQAAISSLQCRDREFGVIHFAAEHRRINGKPLDLELQHLQLLLKFLKHNHVFARGPAGSGKTEAARTYLLWLALFRADSQVFWLAPDDRAAAAAADKLCAAYGELRSPLDVPVMAEVLADNAPALEFANGSRIRVETAADLLRRHRENLDSKDYNPLLFVPDKAVVCLADFGRFPRQAGLDVIDLFKQRAEQWRELTAMRTILLAEPGDEEDSSMPSANLAETLWTNAATLAPVPPGTDMCDFGRLEVGINGFHAATTKQRGAPVSDADRNLRECILNAAAEVTAAYAAPADPQEVIQTVLRRGLGKQLMEKRHLDGNDMNTMQGVTDLLNRFDEFPAGSGAVLSGVLDTAMQSLRQYAGAPPAPEPAREYADRVLYAVQPAEFGVYKALLVLEDHRAALLRAGPAFPEAEKVWRMAARDLLAKLVRVYEHMPDPQLLLRLAETVAGESAAAVAQLPPAGAFAEYQELAGRLAACRSLLEALTGQADLAGNHALRNWRDEQAYQDHVREFDSWPQPEQHRWLKAKCAPILNARAAAPGEQAALRFPEMDLNEPVRSEAAKMVAGDQPATAESLQAEQEAAERLAAAAEADGRRLKEALADLDGEVDGLLENPPEPQTMPFKLPTAEDNEAFARRWLANLTKEQKARLRVAGDGGVLVDAEGNMVAAKPPAD